MMDNLLHRYVLGQSEWLFLNFIQSAFYLIVNQGSARLIFGSAQHSPKCHKTT